MKKIIQLLSVGVLAAMSCVACGSTKQDTAINTAASVDYAIEKLTRAESLMYDREYSDAIKIATEVIESEGPSAYALTIRGISYAKINKPYFAFADLVEATKIDYNASTLVNIGNAERMFGHCERAADAFQKASILAPNDSQILTNLASAYLCYGKLDLAEEALNKSQRANPNDEVLMTNWAIFYAMKGDFALSMEVARKAVEANPAYAPAHSVLSHACGNVGDKECAHKEEDLYKALLNPRRSGITL